MSDYLRFRDGFAEAMDPAFHTIEELDAKVSAGRAILFATEQSAIVVEVERYPGALVAHGLCAAGDLDEIAGDLIPKAEHWARLAGCTHALIESRPGWAKTLKDGGYTVHTVTLRKQL